MFQSGYHRVNVRKAGVKFYAPFVRSFGRLRHLKRTFGSATEAKEYAARFAGRLWRLLHEFPPAKEG